MFFRKIENVLHQRNDDEAVRRRKNLELWRLRADFAERPLDVAFPVLVQQLGVLARLDVKGNNLRRKPRSEFQRLFADAAPAVDGHNHDGMAPMLRGNDCIGAGGGDHDGVIMTPHSVEEKYQQRNKEQRDPCAFREFRD